MDDPDIALIDPDAALDLEDDPPEENGLNLLIDPLALILDPLSIVGDSSDDSQADPIGSAELEISRPGTRHWKKKDLRSVSLTRG